jgi:branched-chain amino acid aminotransferase
MGDRTARKEMSATGVRPDRLAADGRSTHLQEKPPVRGRLVYFNGGFVAESEARISIFDSALTFGDMVYEVTRSFRQKPYRLRDHLERLYASMRYAEIDCDLALDEMEAATHETVARNLPAMEGSDFQILHDVTRGARPFYEGILKEGLGPVVCISVFPLIPRTGRQARAYEEGVHAVITPQQSVPSRFIDPKAKNRSRIFYKLADLHARRLEAEAWALLTDERGFITEGIGSNFFVACDGEILTPKPHNVLRGISRRTCFSLAGRLGISAREADVEPYDVRGADEAWFTSTPFCVLPAVRFNFQPVGPGKPGPIYKALLAAWSEEVGVDIAGQAREYAERLETWRP